MGTDTNKVSEAYSKGFKDGYRQFDIDMKRYRERYRLETAIMAAMDESEEVGSGGTKELFATWCEDEDGYLAIDRLVNLIIH